MSLPERRVDALSRTEFIAANREIREDLKQILEYQRETNGKVATAYERLATLTERTENLKDSPARAASLISLALAVLAFLVGMLRNAPIKP